ncbi:MAG: hypothetical protein Q9163_002218 [Psora crenata]
MAMQLKTLLNPITGLAFIKLDRLCLIVAEGQYMKIFDHATGRLHCMPRIFASQVIHGFTCNHSQSTASYAATVLVWGGLSLRVIAIRRDDCGESGRQLRISNITDEIRVHDWILDAHFRVQCYDHCDPSTDDEAVFVTAHNDLHLLATPNPTFSDNTQGQSIRKLSFGPRSILYSAHIAWDDSGGIVVACGTVTGEILVWSLPYRQQYDYPTTARVHYNLAGHEGSVFGVRVSEKIKTDTATTSRMLASCSDDRTIRIWDITGIDRPSLTGSAGICLAKVMGHASRIWSLRFLTSNQCIPRILSFGEDGTAQLWQIRSRQEDDAAVESVDDLPLRMVHETTYAFHAGKNIWAATIHLEGNGNYVLATGGADGRLVSYGVSLKDPLPNFPTLHEHTMAQALGSCNIAADDHDAEPQADNTSVIRKIFDAMIGQFKLARTISSAIHTQPSGSLYGVANITQREVTDESYDAESVYFEQGDFNSDLGITMRATRRYVYRYQASSDTISVWFVKLDGTSVDYHFHNLSFEESETLSPNPTLNAFLCARGHHLCDDDQYAAEYLFSFTKSKLKEWKIKYNVRGPRKKYVSEATYTLYSGYTPPDTVQRPHLNLMRPSTKNGKTPKQDSFGRYAWISDREFLATTGQGNVLLGKMLADTGEEHSSDAMLQPSKADFKWEFVGSQDDLQSISLITSCVHQRAAFLTGKSGTIYAYNHASQTINVLKRGNGKLGFLQARTSNGRSLFFLLTCALGSNVSEIYHMLPGEPTCAFNRNLLSNLKQDEPMGGKFITSCWCDNEVLQMIVEGSRDGQLRFHETSGRSRQTVSNLHSGNTVTVLLWLFKDDGADYLLTAGRDGTYSVHKLEHAVCNGSMSKFETIHIASPPFGPNIEGASVNPITRDIILWGFNSTRFIVWNESQHAEVMSVECGGAHRNWAYHHHDETGGGNFVWTKASTCHVYSQPRPSHRVLQSGGHGREIKAMAISPSIEDYNRKTSVRLIATGAEDTAIRLFKHEGGTFKCINLMRAHRTGIQKLQWSPDGRWLFSAGGCEQFFAWRVRVLNGTPTMVCDTRCPHITDEKDLRVMDFHVTVAPKSYRIKPSKPDYILYMAYSDSSIRIWRFRDKTDGESIETERFTMLSDGFYNTNCLTQIHHLDFGTAGKLLTTSTDGHIALWDSTIRPTTMDLMGSQRYRVHQSSIKSLAAISLPSPQPTGTGTITANAEHETANTTSASPCEHLIITGGDDQALGITRVPNHSAANESIPRRPATILIPNAHASAITAVAYLGYNAQSNNDGHDDSNGSNSNVRFRFRFASVSDDQRLKTWHAMIDQSQQGVEGVHVRRGRNVYTSVADASSLDAYEEKDEDEDENRGGVWRLFVAGIGMECWRVTDGDGDGDDVGGGAEKR